MSRRIGLVLAVKGPHVVIEVDPHISDLHVRHGGKTYSIGQPGSYLTIGRGHERFLILVTTVQKTPWGGLEINTQDNFDTGLPAGDFPFLPQQTELKDRTLINGIVVGTICGEIFEIGVAKFPIVSDAAMLAVEKDMKIALEPEKNKNTISLGMFADSNISVCLDIDELLGKHTAIVGTTGCGKSYTVAKLLSKIANKYPSANIVLFDLHGEYKKCFENSNYIRADELKLPAWLHSFEDLFELCADLSNQFNVHNQRWAFREGIFRLKQLFCKDVIKNNTLAENLDLDAPIPFDIKELGNWLDNNNRATKKSDEEIITYIGENNEKLETAIDKFDWFNKKWAFQNKTRSKITGCPFYGELDRLVIRFFARLNDPRYNFLFKYDKPKKDDLKSIAEKVSGLSSKDPKTITVFDLSYLPHETVGMVVATISRILFQIHFLSERQKYIPSLVVYEEAHNYIARQGRGSYGNAKEIVERIAKEGRKFGIGTLVVSQRPSELSETLLSQCNTFLCMRLANQVDKNYIINLLPDSMSEMIDILPVLPQGQLLAVGQASKMLVRISVDKIEDENKKPDSDNPKFGENWKNPLEQRKTPNIEDICKTWISSQKEK